MATSGRKIQIRQGSSTAIPILDIGEPAFTTDTKKLYIGSNSGNVLIDTSLDNIPNATTTVKGLMSPADKVKLNNIDTSKIGTVKSVNGILPNTNGVVTIDIPSETVITNNLTSTSTVNALSANQGKILNDKITQLSSNGGYDLPNATASVLGGVKIGTNITVSSGTISVANANTSVRGAVQLNNTVTSTSSTLAATANSVKIAYDKAVEAMSSGGGSTVDLSDYVKRDGTVAMQYLTVGSRRGNTGLNSAVIGSMNQASDSNTFAQGSNSVASGIGSSTLGYDNVSSGRFSHSVGSGSESTADYAIAIGQQCVSSGINSVGLGASNLARGRSSTALGYGTIANADYSTTTGNATTADAIYSLAMGSQNKTMESSANFSTNNDAFVIGNTQSYNAKSNAFRVKFNGSVYGLSAFNSSGADYAEYFEWSDGNIDNQDLVGYVVTLDGEKIRKANCNDDYILGIISATPSVIGDSHQDDWSGRYLKDQWGRFIEEEYEFEKTVIDESGIESKVISKNVEFKENPEWVLDKEYVSREKRKEWSPVGLVGKLLVRDDGTSEVNGYAKVGSTDGVTTKSEEITNMRVMERINKNIIRVFIK